MWYDWSELYGRRGLENASRHMTMLHEILREQKIKLTVVVYPWPDQIFQHETESRQVTHWRGWAARQEVDFLDLFPAFIDERDPETVIREHFIPMDIHWNQRGHDLIRAKLLDHLDRSDG